MAKSINVDFYRVDMPAGFPWTFGQMIQKVADIPFKDPRRAKDVGGVPIRMQEEGVREQMFNFDIVRIEMDDLPALVKLSGETEELDLDDDQGVGTNTACLYHEPSRVLAIQSGRSGPSLSTVVQYFFEALNRSDDTASLVPLVRKDGWDEVKSLGAFRGIAFSVAGFGNLDLKQADGNRSASSTIDFVKRFGAHTATVHLGLGHADGSLSKIIELAEGLFSLKGKKDVEVRKIEITGKNDDGGQKVVDLIKYRLRSKVKLDGEETRHVDYATRAAAVEKAWREHSIEARLISGVEPKRNIK